MSKKFTITLDPGHVAGYNTGIITSYKEGTIMFNLATYMKTELENSGLFTVYLTRNNVNENPGVDLRGQMAVKNKSDIFISLHSDAASTSGACGVTIFNSTRRASSKAFLEGYANTVATVMKKVNNTTYSRGILTRLLADGRDYLGVIRNAVVDNTISHVFLIEHGFHTNKNECEFLNNDLNIRTLAKESAKYLIDFFKNSNLTPALTKSESSIPMSQPVTTTYPDSTFVVLTELRGYSTATDAMVGINPKNYIAPGKYFIYRSFTNGSINVASVQGKPGSWINPNLNKKLIDPASQNVPSGVTPITISANNKPIITKAQAIQFIKNSKAAYKLTVTLETLIDYYIELGNLEGIRWDIALAQSIKETGYWKYGGQVAWNQNNYAGIGATNGGAAGAIFQTAYMGVLAQIHHLKAYANKEWCIKPVASPRFGLVTRGWAPYVEWLGRDDNPNNVYDSKLGKWTTSIGWAVPGKGYGASIMDIVNKIAAIKV